MGEQGIAADGIQFAKDIVDEQQRRRAFFVSEQLRLGNFQCESNCALLAFGRVMRRLLLLNK